MKYCEYSPDAKFIKLMSVAKQSAKVKSVGLSVFMLSVVLLIVVGPS